MSRESRAVLEELRQAGARAVRVGKALKAAAAQGARADMQRCVKDARAVIRELIFLWALENDDETTRH